MLNDNTLYLTSDLIIGVGHHKTTYLHPSDATLCIKIPFHQNDIDIKRELKYRSILNKRAKTPALLPKYQGTVYTNKGIGYVFERISDYDGKTSSTLLEYIKFLTTNTNTCDIKIHFQYILSKLHKTWLEEKIVTSDADPMNFLVQRISPTECTIRIVDNIGTPVLIPLAYYIDYIAERRVQRYWKRLLKNISEKTNIDFGIFNI